MLNPLSQWKKVSLTNFAMLTLNFSLNLNSSVHRCFLDALLDKGIFVKHQRKDAINVMHYEQVISSKLSDWEKSEWNVQ